MFSYKNSLLTLLLLGTFVACSNPKEIVVECAYLPKKVDQQDSEFSPQGECGKLIDEDTLVLYPEHFRNLNFEASNLTTVYSSGRVFYVSKSGSIVRSLFFDNGADFFEEGLSRIISKKKIGFVNEQLETVIEPQFDFAYSFKDSKSMVCNGCKEEKEPNGEHTMIVGGKWGIINKKGEVILPLEYDIQEVYTKLNEL